MIYETAQACLGRRQYSSWESRTTLTRLEGLIIIITMAICLPYARPHYVLITREPWNNKHTGTCMPSHIIRKRLLLFRNTLYIWVHTRVLIIIATMIQNRWSVINLAPSQTYGLLKRTPFFTVSKHHCLRSTVFRFLLRSFIKKKVVEEDGINADGWWYAHSKDWPSSIFYGLAWIFLYPIVKICK